jgi:hypothetical protein
VTPQEKTICKIAWQILSRERIARKQAQPGYRGPGRPRKTVMASTSQSEIFSGQEALQATG